MRGAPQEGAEKALQPRIIPADAGSTQLGNDYMQVLEDHPRGCGEHCVSGLTKQ